VIKSPPCKKSPPCSPMIQSRKQASNSVVLQRNESLVNKVKHPCCISYVTGAQRQVTDVRCVSIVIVFAEVPMTPGDSLGCRLK